MCIRDRARTGKKNVMRLLMNAALMRNADIVVIEHGSNECNPDSELLGATYIDSEAAQADYFTILEPAL